MAYAQKLHLRLFLEGVEVPVISAQVSSGVDAPASCAIQIPANDFALELKPRTLVHLFFYDFYKGAPSESRAYVAGAGITSTPQEEDPELADVIRDLGLDDSTAAQDAEDLRNENYKLLFGGEIVGVQMMKGPTQRGIVLQCLDWSSYWDYAYQYQVSAFNFTRGGIHAAFTGAATTVFREFLEGSGDIVTHLLEQPPRSYPRLRGTLLGGLMHLIEAIGGTYYGPRAIRGVNDFFSLAEMKLHLTQMVGASPYANRDERRLLHAHGFAGLFHRTLRGLGKQISIRSVLVALEKYLFYQIVPITTPRYLPSPVDPRVPQYEEVSLQATRETQVLARAARQLKRKAEDIKTRQEESTTPALAARRARAHHGVMLEVRQWGKVATVAADRAERINRHRTMDGRFDQLFQLTGVVEKFRAAARGFAQVLNNLDTVSSPNRFFLADARQGAAVVHSCEQISSTMDELLNATFRRRIRRRTSQPDPPPRLFTQIWRPDVWMVAPPRSNVLFPELYSSMTYARQFLAETSRLLLRTHSAFFGSDFLFDGYYMAPSNILGQRTNHALLRGGHQADERQQDPDEGMAWVIRDLMDHELYTGIIPKFERMSDLNLFALRGGSFMSGNTRIGYAQLAVNNIFFKQRFQSRSLNVSGKFNPWLIHGFPTVVIDKYLSDEEINNSDTQLAVAARLAEAATEGEGVGEGVAHSLLSQLPPGQLEAADEAARSRIGERALGIDEPRPDTHYLGTSSNLVHNVSVQGGGQTSITMGYARTTNEQTEFLGSNRDGTRGYTRTHNLTRVTVVAWTEPPLAARRDENGELIRDDGGLTSAPRGPRGGLITRVQDVTEQYRRRQRARPSSRNTATGQRRNRFASGSLVTLWVPGGTRIGRRRRGTKVPVGISQAASAYGPEVVALVGTVGNQQSSTDDREVVFNAYRITEELGVYRETFDKIPPEVLTFPPWYGESWTSGQVGGLYSYLFGTGSIVDPTTFLRPGELGPAGADGGDPSGVVDPQRDLAFSLPEGEHTVTDPEEDRPAEGMSDHAVGDQPYGDPTGEGESPPTISGRGSINDALAQLVRVYSRVRHERWDTDDFIHTYTYRPIASMVDVLGTANLEINDNGEVLRGREGFHSRAFGNFDDLRQLVQNVEGQPPRILGLTTTDPQDTRTQDDRRRAEQDEGIAARMDTRKERRLQVLRYLSSLMTSRGILG